MKLTGFVGPFGTTRSRTFDGEDTINLYLEQREAGNPRSDWALYGRPGLRVGHWWPIGDTPVRGLFSQDGRAFGVSGTTFGELQSAGGAVTHTGTVASNNRPASFSSNGSLGFQTLITVGGEGYVFDLQTDTLTPIADAHFPADVTQNAYFEGYSVVLVGDSPQFNISALLDSTDWDGLDVYQRNIGSDNFVSMVQNHRELVLLGSRTSLIYTNTGDASTPLQPLPGVLIQQGCLATYSAIRLDNTVAWLGQDEKGQAIVYALNGYTPQRISTYPVEHYLAQSADLTLTEAFSFQMQGHLWVGWYVPDLDQTLMYDASTQQWCKWAEWNIHTASWEPFRGTSACNAFGDILIGDRSSRTVYRLEMDAYDDALAVA